MDTLEFLSTAKIRNSTFLSSVGLTIGSARGPRADTPDHWHSGRRRKEGTWHNTDGGMDASLSRSLVLGEKPAGQLSAGVPRRWAARGWQNAGERVGMVAMRVSTGRRARGGSAKTPADEETGTGENACSVGLG